MFVLNKHGQPLQPTSPAYARKLLRSGRAVVHRHTPFVIRLKDRTAADSVVAGVQVGIDPDSKHTGKKTGVHFGRIAVRSTGSFNITTRHGTVQGIHHRHIRLLQRADGYGYTTHPEARHHTAFPPGPEGPSLHAGGN
ncbi:RRXRR domain-containing protein [Streptosporangium sp. NPDC006930]|uniref:RRXRR domain-containing protein n=1 Tax=Streptosporangium sp. NPDC006930 TaxID=3154783 RepID=UPI003422A2AB